MDISVTQQADKQRFLLTDGGAEIGRVDYQLRGDVLVMTHTEVDPARREHGLGRRLVTAALDQVRAQGRRVVPLCPYVGHVIDTEPGYADLLAHAAPTAAADRRVPEDPA